MFLLTGLLVFQMATGQNDLKAKLKYEEAEESFNKNDFSTTVSKLDEAEKILGKTNPKILYLKINSQFQLAEADFETVQSLKKNCDYFLNNYENITGIEDKFREVYKISSAIEKYPATKEAYLAWTEEKQKEKIAEAIARKEKANAKLMEEKLASWGSGMEGVEIGMNFSELPGSVWSYLGKDGMFFNKGDYGIADRDCISYTAKYKALKIKSSAGIDGILIDKSTNKVFQISKKHMVGGKSSIDESKKVYEELVAKMKLHFGAENIIEEESTAPLNTKKGSYFNKKATIKNSPYIQYFITQNIYYFGGVLGTECNVTETYSLVKIK